MGNPVYNKQLCVPPPGCSFMCLQSVINGWHFETWRQISHHFQWIPEEINRWQASIGRTRNVNKGTLRKDQTQFKVGTAQHRDLLATKHQPSFAILSRVLQQAQKATSGQLRIEEYTTVVQINSDDRVKLFDPHPRDNPEFVSGNGKAVIINFSDIKTHSFPTLTASLLLMGPTIKWILTWHSFELPLFVKSKHCGPSTKSRWQ